MFILNEKVINQKLNTYLLLFDIVMIILIIVRYEGVAISLQSFIVHISLKKE